MTGNIGAINSIDSSEALKIGDCKYSFYVKRQNECPLVLLIFRETQVTLLEFMINNNKTG